MPHFDGEAVTQFITFRLADSLPLHVLEGWKQELAQQTVPALPEPEYQIELQRRTERYLDQGAGARHLQETRVAALVEKSLYHFDGERYRLLCWAIMPNHVHLLLTPRTEHSLTGIMRSLKSYTAHEANKLLKRTGKFWFEDYFDRYIRDADHYAAVVRYIENNPVKAGLCQAPEEWRYSSAWWRNRSAVVPTAE
ncbi:MAG TPA: transposase [Blastocatellia bacterium]|nr:transposase [Blastocatellia bacterium]HMV87686.1 transposase [Blastocatellia bacterium]HMX26101.1 transposase [Blastocatellia bacterium]HMY71850.1 transposase [Blastocatellia bacterium]HMZ21378.1 transposase [Blastocatellia bacterium]